MQDHDTWWVYIFSFFDLVLLLQLPASQQCFPLTPLQQQPPATSQPTVFFSYTTPAASSSTSTANIAFMLKNKNYSEILSGKYMNVVSMLYSGELSWVVLSLSQNKCNFRIEHVNQC